MKKKLPPSTIWIVIVDGDPGDGMFLSRVAASEWVDQAGLDSQGKVELVAYVPKSTR